MAVKRKRFNLGIWWSRRLSELKNRWFKISRFAAEIDLLATGVLFFLAFAIWALWHVLAHSFGAEYRTEFMGLIFDIFFILILFSVLQYRGRRSQTIARQQEVVEDYKRWDSEEARFRLAGALRRLNRLGVTAIDLTGLQLSGFSFADNKIENISGSTFYDGSWGEPFKPHEVKVTKVSFDWVDCSKATFSPFNPLQGLGVGPRWASFIDCTFRNSNLNGSSFAGATMVWKEEPPDSLYELDHVEDGETILTQVREGPFREADLTNASFRDVHFKNADFRQSLNIALANFEGATGLDTCVFDEDALENEVLEAAGIKVD